MILLRVVITMHSMALGLTQMTCTTGPAMSVNDGDLLQNADIPVNAEQVYEIRCFSCDLNANITEVKIWCEWAKDTPITDVSMATINSFIDINLHRQKCFCQSTFSNGTQEESYARISYQSVLFFRNISGNHSSRSGEEGSDIAVSFEAFVNPQLTSHDLIKGDSSISTDNYEFKVVPVNASIFSKVTVTFLGVIFLDAGRYSLLMDNRMGVKLKYGIKITVNKGTSTHDDDFIGKRITVVQGLAIGIPSLILLVPICVGIVSYMCSGKGENSLSNVKSENPFEESSDSEAEEGGDSESNVSETD